MVASAATVAVLAGGGAALAAGDTQSNAESATVSNLVSGPFHVNFNATRPANMPADHAAGDFDAKVLVGGHQFVHLQGPVTCLDVRGNNIGLFYPVTKAEPLLFGKAIRGVYIYVTVDGKGNVKGFASSVSHRPYPSICAPVPGVLPATGSGTASS